MKDFIRRSIKNKISGITNKQEQSDKVINQLVNTYTYKNAKYISVYVPRNDEIDTTYILNDKSKECFTPKIINDTDMIMVNKNGIICDVFDLIIVPGITFNKKGDRLGRGKGYYDRFLLNKVCPTVGLCFIDQLVDNIPVENHDMRLSYVISPNED